MKNPDFSEYERRRAQDHEEAWRLSATLKNIHSRYCHYRMCRRRQFCLGPMLPSPHQSAMIRAHKEIGLSGKACAPLPMCMANATAARYAFVSSVLKDITTARNGNMKDLTFWDVLFLIRRQARSRHRKTLRT